MKRIIRDYLSKIWIYKIFMSFVKFIKKFKNNFKKAYRKKDKRIDYLIYRFYTLKYRYPKEYKKYSKLPIEENKVVFVELRLPTLTNSFSVMFNELVENYDLNIHVHFPKNTFVSRVENYKSNLAIVRDMATARYVFNVEGTQVIGCLKLREETQIVNLWHGCGAFKKFGLSTSDLIFGETRKNTLKYPYHLNNTLVTTSSPEVIWAYEEAMNHKHEDNIVKALGVSRTDFFYKQENIDKAYETLYTLFPQAQGKKVILFAPTFRGRVANARTSTKFNLEMFYKELGDEYVVICKHHPLAKKVAKIPEHLSDFAIDFTKKMSIDDLLCVSDICISDYSSLVFEYSLFERPLIFFAYDLDNYFDWRGFYYDYFELAPGPICKKNSEMIDYIKNIETRFDKQRVIDFKNKFMSSCDGHATQRIIDEVFGDKIDKYKRETPLENLEYNKMIPENFEFCEYIAKVDKLTKLKPIAAKAYNDNINKPIKKGKIVILSNSEKGHIYRKHLAKKLKKLPDIEVFATRESFIVDSMKRIVPEFSDAEKIIVLCNSQLLNLLDIRKETEVIYMSTITFPLRKFGYDNNNYLECLKKEFKELIPMHSNVNKVICADPKMIEIYDRAINHKVEYISGSMTQTYLKNKKVVEKNKKLLFEAIPTAENKKIILYMPTKRKFNKSNVILPKNILEEFLSDDYIVLFSDGTEEPLLKENMPVICDEFQIKINQVSFELIQALSVADIVIGDFRRDIFEAALLGKPVFIYNPDGLEFKNTANFNYDLPNINFGVEVEDAFDLVEKIIDIENYDYSIGKKFKKEYCKDCNKNLINGLIK